MVTDPQAMLHGPLFSRSRPLDRENAASRISAYVYGNVLVLAALVPITTSEKYVGILVVLGTSLSTFVAHAFAEGVGQSVRHRQTLSRAEKIGELRNSVPILSSAVLPCVILATGWFGWLEPRTAQVLAELAVLIRIAGIVFVVGRLNGERPSRDSVIGGVALTTVAVAVVVVKIVLTH